jgi:hypothetical protein
VSGTLRLKHQLQVAAVFLTTTFSASSAFEPGVCLGVERPGRRQMQSRRRLQVENAANGVDHLHAVRIACIAAQF